MTRPTVLVTGATRGIGRALASALGATHHVLVGGRDAASVAAVVAGLPDAAGFVADLADEEAVTRACAQVKQLDVLVHCAGIMPPEGVGLRAAWRAAMEVNVIAVADLTERLLPSLRASRGLVVMINSGSGLNAWSDTSGYSASKFALTSYADGLREAERGEVRVASIHPGRVDTDMQRELQRRLGRPYEASEHLSVAAVVSAVRAAILAPEGAVVETLSIRPAGPRPR